MPDFTVDSFGDGIDLRRHTLHAAKSSLRDAMNVVLTPGGELAKRFAFVPVTDPLDTTLQGLWGQGGKLHIFGYSGVALPQPTLPIDPIVTHLLAPPGQPLLQVPSVQFFKDRAYVVGLLGDGVTTRHWYDDAVATGSTMTASLLNYTQTPSGVGSALRQGTYALVFGNKVYWADGPYLRFSSLDDPTTDQDLTDGSIVGGGFIDVSSQDQDAESVSSMEVYYGNMAVFAPLMTQIWTLDSDPNNNSIFQKLRLGNLAPRTSRQFGTGDVLFLANSGIRSLRAMNISMAAAVIDVGSPIDSLLQAYTMQNLAEAQSAIAVVQPVFGRYWLAIQNQIFSLSYFPSSKISAWTRFVLDFNVLDMCVLGTRVYVRGRDIATGDIYIYLYAGTDGATYDQCQVQIITPMYSDKEAGIWKGVRNFNALMQGQWQVMAGMLPNAPTTQELLGTFGQPTYDQQYIAFDGYGTHIGFTFNNQAAGPAMLGEINLFLREGRGKEE